MITLEEVIKFNSEIQIQSVGVGNITLEVLVFGGIGPYTYKWEMPKAQVLSPEYDPATSTGFIISGSSTNVDVLIIRDVNLENAYYNPIVASPQFNGFARCEVTDSLGNKCYSYFHLLDYVAI